MPYDNFFFLKFVTVSRVKTSLRMMAVVRRIH